VFKFIEPAEAHIGLGFVHAGLTSGTTVIVWVDVS
jgi:hypothetical protein